MRAPIYAFSDDFPRYKRIAEKICKRMKLRDEDIEDVVGTLALAPQNRKVSFVVWSWLRNEWGYRGGKRELRNALCLGDDLVPSYQHDPSLRVDASTLLAPLNKKEKKMALLYWAFDYSLDNIGRKEGVCRSAVHQKMGRIKKKIHKHLGEEINASLS